MSTPSDLQQRTAAEDRRQESGANCEGGTCSTGMCSPCLFIGGGIAVFLLAQALVAAFR